MQMAECILVKTLLVLGAGQDQIPGLIKAREMGLYTVVLDGNPEAKGKSLADEFHQVSIKHFQQIESFIDNTLDKSVDGVIAFGVDIPYIIARTATRLGVNYTIKNEAAQLSEDKYQSKCFMEEQGVNIPAFKLVSQQQEIETFIKQHQLPIIIKPIDNSAARGVSFINSFDQIEEAFAEAFNNTQSDKILIEKYLAGPQVSTESFIINGEIHNIGFADRNYSNMERFFPHIIEDGGDLPSLYMTETLKYSLTKQLQLIIDGLGINNAVIKGDIVIYEDKLFIIEFALRLSGGNFSTVEIPENTGVDFLKIAIKLHLNESINASQLSITQNKHISIRYKFVEDNLQGKIKSLTIPDENENIILQAFHANPGDIITTKTKNHANRLGFVISKGSSRESATRHAEQQILNMGIQVD
ncbi:ATP-grasp domain-containing protein [Psychromonas sp. SR45-3]|uniref:ATP-binding protein n=1 Tax=Psychromonas sp. SR45-3 TaxID=2760930 RepID=UPI0015F9EEF8|nr:ATP-grasp domain-containing protein [Psychromonas sp. SR45-3]MBB1271637.1 ATP-grasp domain-containing protein [Psychromonas sp. SR45-3]